MTSATEIAERISNLVVDLSDLEYEGILLVVSEELRDLEAERARLATALELAAPFVCSHSCPSVKKTGTEWTHSEICHTVTAALAPSARAAGELWRALEAEHEAVKNTLPMFTSSSLEDAYDAVEAARKATGL